ncbi:hypothetical protein ACFO8L_24410 [Sphaerisporangium corydalis]|uniref:Baseplate protein J-like domain-containing protein n=1 Tax=Sphaerisporangium corydalis TaxID=1441875 RepID=A0ABV9EI51_9ACTN
MNAFGFEVAARLDLVAEESLQGAGTRLTREAGVLLGRPLVVPVRPEDLPPEVSAARGAGRWTYTQLRFPFDLEEAEPGLSYVEAVFQVALDDSDVVARRLSLVHNDDPAPVEADTVTTFGDGRDDFRWRMRPEPGGALAEGGRAARVLLEVPQRATSLTGTIGVSARLRDTELGIEVPVRVREPRRFTLDLTDGTFTSVPVAHRRSPESSPAIAGPHFDDFPAGLEAAPGTLPPHLAASPPALVRAERVNEDVRRMFVTADVEGYGKRDPAEQKRAQSVLVRVMDGALNAAHVYPREEDHQQQGDGHLIVMPPAIDEPRVIRWFLRELASELAVANQHVRPEYEVRLRVALDEDMVFPAVNGFGGEGVVRAHRLRDSAEAKSALAESRGHFIVIVSERFYLSSVRPAFAGEPEWRFTEATATVADKGFSEPCRLHIPDR